MAGWALKPGSHRKESTGVVMWEGTTVLGTAWDSGQMLWEMVRLPSGVERADIVEDSTS